MPDNTATAALVALKALTLKDVAALDTEILVELHNLLKLWHETIGREIAGRVPNQRGMTP